MSDDDLFYDSDSEEEYESEGEYESEQEEYESKEEDEREEDEDEEEEEDGYGSDPDEVQLQAGYADEQRTSAREGDIGGDIVGGKGDFADRLRRLNVIVWRLNTSPREKFIYVLNNIRESNEFDLSAIASNAILSAADRISKPEFTNPIAFVLGYKVINQVTKEIDRDLLDNVSKNILPKIATNGSDQFITEIDIIRYARYWIIHLLST